MPSRGWDEVVPGIAIAEEDVARDLDLLVSTLFCSARHVFDAPSQSQRTCSAHRSAKASPTLSTLAKAPIFITATLARPSIAIVALPITGLPLTIQRHTTLHHTSRIVMHFSRR